MSYSLLVKSCFVLTSIKSDRGLWYLKPTFIALKKAYKTVKKNSFKIMSKSVAEMAAIQLDNNDRVNRLRGLM